MFEKEDLEFLAQEAFNKLGFTPKGNQLETVALILEQYLVYEKKYVILCAPTGTGKSVIGAAVGAALGAWDSLVKDETRIEATEEESEEGKKRILDSICVTATNTLTDQYDKTFTRLIPYQEYMAQKGASNYPCTYLSQVENKDVNAEFCVNRFIINTDPEEAFKHCGKCEFIKNI